MNIRQKKCKLCKKNFRGRADKVYCSISCKSSYHRKLKDVTVSATVGIDSILHRNRSILLEILTKNGKYRKVPRSVLDKKKFNYQFITHYHTNSQNKFVNFVYDISWIIFSDQEVLIRRVK